METRTLSSVTLGARRRALPSLGSLGLALVLVANWSHASTIPQVSKTAPAAVHKQPVMPMLFQPGADPQAGYSARGPGYAIQLSETGAALQFVEAREGAAAISSIAPGGRFMHKPGTSHFQGTPARITLKFANQGAAKFLQGEDQAITRFNYFKGNDPAKWRTDVPGFNKVRLAEVYDGIDLVFYGTGGVMEYDFVVKPGGDASRVAMDLGGVKQAHLSLSGDLLLETGTSQVVFHKPVIYQLIEGRRTPVKGSFALASSGSENVQRLSFNVGAYNHDLPLVIDPVLTYSTYLGGSSTDIAWDVALDSAGNAFVAGETSSADFPLTKPILGTYFGGQTGDAFLAKFDPAGRMLFCSYIGGTDDDGAFGVAVDAAGDAYVVGYTDSTRFPTVNAIQKNVHGVTDPFLGYFPYDAFVTKVSGTGNRIIYSTYLGGSFPDFAAGIAVDAAGNAFITGVTESLDFPTLNAQQASHSASGEDAFLTKLSPDGSQVLFSTYLGGSSRDFGQGVAVDRSGNVTIAGLTTSTDFPVLRAIQGTNGGDYDGFVAKYTSGGVMLYSTYLGGKAQDDAYRVAVDATGAAYIVGDSISTNFPIVNPAMTNGTGLAYDAYLTKLAPDGSSIIYSTLIGASGRDLGWGVAVDGFGSAVVVGESSSPNFPVVDALQGPSGSGLSDSFIVRITPDGKSVSFSTLLGGSGNDIGHAVAIAANGDIVIAGEAGSSDFPTFNATQPFFSSGVKDGFVARITAGVAASNNLFANRKVLVGAPIRLVDSNWAATTNEVGEPSHGGTTGGNSIWWTWSPPTTGTYLISAAESSFSAGLGVYTGTVLTNLTAISTNGNFVATSYVVVSNAPAGTPYQIAVQGIAGVSGVVILSIRNLNDYPANDAFTNSITITGATVATTGNNRYASFEVGEPVVLNSPDYKSVWWSWTAPSAGLFEISTAGSDFDTLLGVFTGSAVSSLTTVAANDDDSAGGTSSRVVLNATSGTTYRIRVTGTSGGEGNINLAIRPAVPPVNDGFASATALAGSSVTVSGATHTATRETGEPNHAGVTGVGSIWYSWTAPAAGRYRITTAGSSFDTLLAVYTGTAVNSLFEVASNDNDPDRATTQSQVTFDATAGTSYRIAVDGKGTARGNLTLSIDSLTAPANDNFANRFAVTGTQAQVTGSSAGATKESGEPNHAGVIGGKSVWFSWTAPAAGPVTITTRGSSFDTILAVYTGTAVNSLSTVAYNDDDPSGASASRLSFQATAGTTYQIALDGAKGASGNFALSLYQGSLLGGATFVNGAAYFNLSGAPGDVVVIEASSNLITWTPISTNTFSGGSISVVDKTAPSNGGRFYRARSRK